MAVRPGPRRALTEDAILDAALALLDEGGLEAASVRRIAAAVGVAPNAVYTYFPDKAAVQAALVDRLLGEVEYAVLADRALPWRERVRVLALDVRGRLCAHPGAVALLMGGPMDGPNALALGERLLALLAEAGLAREAAARASYLVMVYVLGAVALEVAEHTEPGPLPAEAARIAARTAAFASLPADRYPRTAAAADTIATYVSTDQFIWGLDRVLAGVVPL